MTHVEFMKLFDGLFSQNEKDSIELAYILSKDAHRSQQRIDGERYFEHPRRVALIYFNELKKNNADEICACLLHDTIEDTLYINERKLGMWFNTDVADLVVALSKVPGKTQREYFDNLKLYGRAAIIKGCDRLDNLRSLKHTEPEFQWKQIHSTMKFVIPMLEHIRVTWQYETAARLQDLIRLEVAKFPKLDDPYYPQNQKKVTP